MGVGRDRAGSRDAAHGQEPEVEGAARAISSLALVRSSVPSISQPEKPDQPAAEKDDGGGFGNRGGVCELVVGPFSAPGIDKRLAFQVDNARPSADELEAGGNLLALQIKAKEVAKYQLEGGRQYSVCGQRRSWDGGASEP
jgi:hypothetical protein